VSLILPIAHRLVAIQHHALDSPTGPGVQKFSHEQDTDNRNRKEAESTNIPHPSLQTAEELKKQSRKRHAG
jgi:hypothetical protein